jgi:large subunit ribosomal protein L17
LGLKNDLHARREAYRRLGCHKLVKRLFDVVAPAFADNPCGFTRIVKLSLPRQGDSAPMAVIELTHGAPDLVQSTDAAPKAAKSKTRTAGAGMPKTAAKAARRKAPKATGFKASQNTPVKSAAPKKLKIGGE